MRPPGGRDSRKNGGCVALGGRVWKINEFSFHHPDESVPSRRPGWSPLALDRAEVMASDGFDRNQAAPYAGVAEYSATNVGGEECVLVLWAADGFHGFPVGQLVPLDKDIRLLALFQIDPSHSGVVDATW